MLAEVFAVTLPGNPISFAAFIALLIGAHAISATWQWIALAKSLLTMLQDEIISASFHHDNKQRLDTDIHGLPGMLLMTA